MCYAQELVCSARCSGSKRPSDRILRRVMCFRCAHAAQRRQQLSLEQPASRCSEQCRTFRSLQARAKPMDIYPYVSRTCTASAPHPWCRPVMSAQPAWTSTGHFSGVHLTSTHAHQLNGNTSVPTTSLTCFFIVSSATDCQVIAGQTSRQGLCYNDYLDTSAHCM
jgi:hypothetical protein